VPRARRGGSRGVDASADHPLTCRDERRRGSLTPATSRASVHLERFAGRRCAHTRFLVQSEGERIGQISVSVRSPPVPPPLGVKPVVGGLFRNLGEGELARSQETRASMKSVRFGEPSCPAATWWRLVVLGGGPRNDSPTVGRTDSPLGGLVSEGRSNRWLSV
jgi:hypothetical protein